jgi:uncharacterized membrane protein
MSPFNYQTVAVSGVVMLVLDAIYLSATKTIFAEQVAQVQRVAMNIRLPGAFVCYALLIVGLNYFILYEQKTVLEAFLLGIIIYGVFDSTNYALFKQWKLSTAAMDMVWGGILFALTTYITRGLLY